MIANIAAAQRLLFDNLVEPDDSQSARSKPRVPSRRKEHQAASPYVQVVLFDKHDQQRCEAERAKDERARLKRINSLLDLPEYALTKAEVAELEAYIAAGRAAVQATWNSKTEAKRRGFKAGWSTADVFTDSCGRLQWRVDMSPVELHPDNTNGEEGED